MKLASHVTRLPDLVQALNALAQRTDGVEAAQTLLHELAGITVLVARKFTNDRTADGLLEAYYLTTGCISLGMSQADIAHDGNSGLSFLLQNGAERVFQMGFRHIKELAGLPAHTMIADFDNDPYIQQRNIKALFSELCHADPNAAWSGDQRFNKELLIRRENQDIVSCAKWLRKHHHTGPIRDSDLDSTAVIAIAVIFAITGDGRIVARTNQKEIENLVRDVRATAPDIDAGWNRLLEKVPAEYRSLLKTRMDEFRNTIVKRLQSKTALKTIVTEIQNCYAGVEQDVDFD